MTYTGNLEIIRRELSRLNRDVSLLFVKLEANKLGYRMSDTMKICGVISQKACLTKFLI